MICRIRAQRRLYFNDVMVRPVFPDKDRYDGIVGDTGHLGRPVSRQRIKTKEFNHDTRISRVLIHEQADIVTVPEEPHHIANARLIGNVLLHHGPIFVDELIGTMTVLLLSH